MVQLTINLTDEQHTELIAYAASEGYADVAAFAQVKATEVLTGIVREAEAKLRVAINAALADPAKRDAIKAAAGL